MSRKFLSTAFVLVLSLAVQSVQAETTRSKRRSFRNTDDIIRNCQQGRGLANQARGCRAVYADGAMLGNGSCTGAHKGCDYSRSNKQGAAPPVYALHAGKVIWKGTRQDYGKRVVVQNDNGTFTTYSHLSSFGNGIKVGATVKVGTPLGIMGATGSATGIHLHIEEIDANGNYKNPGSAYGRNFC